MKPMHAPHRDTPARIASAALLAAFLASNAMGWSASGTVKSTGGTLLAGVSVTVKDSSKYATTTDAGGRFTFAETTVGLGSGPARSFAATIADGEIHVQGPVDGPIDLDLIDVSGRSLWQARLVGQGGHARAPFPAALGNVALFLRIRHPLGVQHQVVVRGVDEVQLAAPRAAAASYPVLVFKKAGYRDTSFAMTAATATGIAVVMADTVATTTCELGTTFKWKDYGRPIAEPKNNWLAIKDFTMVRHNNQYIVYMTYTPQGGGFRGAYMAPFADFSQAAAAAQTIMPNNLPGVAPELIYFKPKNTWVYTTQWCSTGSFCYTTGSDPTKPTSFAAQTQPLLTENITPNAPIDQVVICDDANCYLFYADDKGNIYRGSMPKDKFPGLFSGTRKILSEAKEERLFEAVEVYKLKGQKKYLMIVECGYPRYFRAFTATDLGGTWTPIANTLDINTPFAGPRNVTNGWSNDISHGEIVRTGNDEYREIDPCNMQMIYQGLTTGGAYNSLPYKMGHLTRIR